MTDWSVGECGVGWMVYWRGLPFGKLWPDEQAANEALGRYARRYAGESAGILLAVGQRKRRKRSGLWGWTRADGTHGTLVASSERAAKDALRHQLGRKRLPSDLKLTPPQ